MKSVVLSIFVILCISFYVVESTNFRSDRDVAKQMFKYATKSQTSKDIEDFKRIVKILSFPTYLLRNSFSTYGKGYQTLSCLTCRSVISTVIKMYHDGYTEEQLVDVMSDLCTVLEVQPGRVCRGLVESNSPIFVYLIENQPLFTPDAFCGVVLQTNDKNSCAFFDPRYDWKIDIPAKKNANKVTKEISLPKNNGTFKVAHFADFHYDPAYEAGGLADCDEPTCCRKGQRQEKSRQQRSLQHDYFPEEKVKVDENGVIYVDIDYANEIEVNKIREGQREMKEEKESDKAGYWGDYRSCDTPWWSFVAGIDQVSENHELDYVYYTGDTIDHGVWETSKEMIAESINATLNKLKSNFKDTKILASFGNHESQPLNQYAPPSVTDPEVSTSWLYELMAEKWGMWLPEDTKETIKIGGYYTVLLKPGFRAVVLNTNLCYVYNWWIHLDPEDPSGQLKWLVKVLTKAESDGEKVHILSHIPNGLTDVYATCSREYRRIIERFSDIIMAEFNGHTHKDEFKIFYEKKNNSNPLSVAWNGGSLTPYSYVNPNYRIFEVDSDTLEVIDFDTWYYNLTEANLEPEKVPKWYKEYSFKEFYNVNSLRPVDIDKLVKRMVTDEKELLSIHYHAFRGKSSESYFQGCNSNCIKKNICYISTTELYDDAKCESLWGSFNQTSN